MKIIKSIYYHNPTPWQFERTIFWLKSKGYKFISSDELYDYIVNKRQMEEKLVYLSLDDAWRGNLLLIPIVEKYHIPITIFAPLEPVLSGNYWWEYVRKEERENFKKLNYKEFCERLSKLRTQIKLERSCMTEEEIIALDRHPLISIESHTVTHPILTSLPDDLLQKELKESKEQLERILQRPVEYFSYPNGSYSNREIEVARAIYKMAFTTDLHDIMIKNDILALPRIEVTGKYYRDKLKFYHVWPVIRKLCFKDNKLCL